MQINNHSPWNSEYCHHWDTNGQAIATLVVKTGYEWDEHGLLLPLAADDYDIEFVDRFHQDDPEHFSLAAAGDMVPFKQGFELHIYATAYSPVASTELEVGVALLRDSQPYWNKSLRVRGKCTWQKGLLGLKASAPELLQPTAITYENTYGGCIRDENNEVKKNRHIVMDNPVGRGLQKPVEGDELPCVFPIADSGKKADKVAGFSPIPAHWQPRWHMMQQIDAQAALENRSPYPSGFPVQAFNSAPLDQQLAQAPQLGDRLRLDHLDPELSTQLIGLPSAAPIAQFNSSQKAIALQWDTLIIDANKKRMYQLWRGHVLGSAAELAMMQVDLQLGEQEVQVA